MSVNSSCKGCVFAEVDTHQTSCKLDRAAKLGIDDKDEDGFFVLSRFCTTYRPKEWLSDLSLAESMDTEKTVLEEIYPRVGFFIVLDTTRDDAIEQLRATVEDIKNQKEIAPRYIVIINDKVEYNEDAFAVVQPLFDFEETEYHILQLQVE